MPNHIHGALLEKGIIGSIAAIVRQFALDPPPYLGSEANSDIDEETPRLTRLNVDSHL